MRVIINGKKGDLQSRASEKKMRCGFNYARSIALSCNMFGGVVQIFSHLFDMHLLRICRSRPFPPFSKIYRYKYDVFFLHRRLIIGRRSLYVLYIGGVLNRDVIVANCVFPGGV